MRNKQGGLALLLASTALFANQVLAEELIVNGGFEVFGADEYDISGWNSAETGALGSVLLENDGSTNASGRNTVGALFGSNYALLDSFTTSNQALSQGISYGAVSDATLSFSMFVNNQSANGTQISLAGLDYTVEEANQHVRVDILNGGANPFSTTAADIAQSFYVGGSNGSSMIGGDVANPYINYVF